MYFILSGNRLSYCQPIKSASVLETLLEPPRISSGSLVSYLTQSSSGSGSSGTNTPRSRASLNSNGSPGVSDCLRGSILSVGIKARILCVCLWCLLCPCFFLSFLFPFVCHHPRVFGQTAWPTAASNGGNVDDVLSNLCRNMILLNQEQQQHSTNVCYASEPYVPANRSLFASGGSSSTSNARADVWAVSSAVTARAQHKQPVARNSAPTGVGCVNVSVAGGGSDPGPVRNSSYSNATAKPHRVSSVEASAVGFDSLTEAVNVNWSLFEGAAAISSRSDPTHTTMGAHELPGSESVGHSKSAPNLQTT